MSVRRPRTAAQSTALPSLAALIASGVVVDGCDTPAQTAERQRRLTEHVSAGMQAPVDPTPPAPPSPLDVDGGVREVRPTPPTPPRVHTPPRPQPHRVPVRGGVSAVRPGPRDPDGF
jgi:hypothetical protein